MGQPFQASISDHIACGRCSGFRWCDIIFFVTVWRWLWQYVPYGKRNYWAQAYHCLSRQDVNYVECPLCKLFRPKIRKLRLCHKNCYCSKKITYKSL
jgi:hypothetical protein